MSKKISEVKISELQAGMIIAKTIYNKNDGVVLLAKGHTLSNEDISNVKKYYKENKDKNLSAADEENIFKVGGTYKYLPGKSSKLVKQAISPENQEQLLSSLADAIVEIEKGGTVSFGEASYAVTGIIDNVLQHQDIALNLLNIKNYDDYTYTHSVNVSIISILIAVKCGFTMKEVNLIGVGALFHDLGKIMINRQILNKPAKLTDEEYSTIKKHPIYTHSLLTKDPDIPSEVKYIASQHHERFDGRGYPNGLKGDKISKFSKIVAIADVYDALTTDRVYRKAMLPYDAMKIILNSSGTHFDPKYVKEFLKGMSIYPAGTYVQLNTGETAVITRVLKDNLLRPDIRIFLDEKGNKLSETIDVEMILDKTRFITKAVDFNIN